MLYPVCINIHSKCKDSKDYEETEYCNEIISDDE